MVQNCCCSHYPFGLDLVWDGIVSSGADATQVSLLLTRDTPRCSIKSACLGTERSECA
jgi:hypothetical protein